MEKTSKAISYLKKGDFKSALSIFKTFKIGFSKEEKRILEIASDCLNGRSLFYQQLGIDVNKIISNSKLIIQSKYNGKVYSNLL